jgi:hypothetical protein
MRRRDLLLLGNAMIVARERDLHAQQKAMPVIGFLAATIGPFVILPLSAKD